MLKQIKNFTVGKRFTLLLIALVGLVSFLALRGIDWGRVEPWEPDQMVYHYLFYDSDQPFNPFWYIKPPFYTYTTYFLVIFPSEQLAQILGIGTSELARTQLIWARTLQFLFLMCGAFLMYKTVKGFNKSVLLSLMIALLFATSAGLQAHVRTLLVDIPTLFWMIVSIYFMSSYINSGKNKDLLLSSFLMGIATANKYNALLLLPVLVWTAIRVQFCSKKELINNVRALVSKLSNVGAFFTFGVILGIPYLIITPKEIVTEIVRMVKVTNVFHGGYSFTGYLSFFGSLSEIIGYPMVVIFLVSLLICLYCLVKKSFTLKQALLLEASLFFLAINYIYFGYYLRLPPRFVIPIVPFVFIVVTLAFNYFNKKDRLEKLFLSMLGLTFAYNIISCYILGSRFISNPRMNFQLWSKEHIEGNSIVEKTNNTPNISLYTGNKLEETLMPEIDLDFSNKLVEALEDNEKLAAEEVELLEKKKQDLDWYTEAALNVRKPDIIVLDSDGYYYILNNNDHPAKRYIEELLSGKAAGYTIIWDESPTSPPWWMYPQYFDFLESRVTVLKKEVI